MGTAGNLSARLNDKMVITASGCSKGELTSTDFVELDVASGQVVYKYRATARPSAETSIHLAVYRNITSALACYHVHSIEANIVSNWADDSGVLKMPEQEMLKGFAGCSDHRNASIKVFENHDDVTLIGAEMSDYLNCEKPDIPLTLIKNHGLTVWAESQDAARNYVELAEYIFRYMVAAARQ